MDTAESTRSTWKSEPLIRRPSLGQNAACDVCVVGAGIAGLSAAYALVRDGHRVIVLDARDVGGGETGQTSAHLASALDDRFSELARVHGERGAQLAYESHARAIDEIESAVHREAIDCDFKRVDGYLFLGPGQDEALLDEELDAARRIGFRGVQRLERAPLESFDTGPCLVFPNQARFHPLRYLAAIATAIERAGASIYTQTRVTSVEDGEKPSVRTKDGFEVRARAVVVATNSPMNLRVPIHSKQAPYRTYVLALTVPSGTVPDALFWDTCDPYHYVRLAPGSAGFDQLIVGGEDQRTATHDDAESRYLRLERWARHRFPVHGDVAARWSGQVLEPFDHLAFIGKAPTGERNVYIATGDSGHGLTHGALAGVLIADLVAGRPNRWQELYDPSRKKVRALPEYMRDNLAVAEELAHWLKPERRRGDQALDPGEGVVVQRGAHKIAVYRDHDGVFHERSAVCTHLGCSVRWNSDAKSWDCRCHGSRFAPTGEVLNGPAVEALREVASEPPRRRSLARSMARGGAGGAVATGMMSAFLVLQKKLGMLGQHPPKKIVRSVRRRLGLFGTPRHVENAATVALHLGFGVLAGALFGLVRRRPRSLFRSTMLGAGYGAAIWTTSYYGWVPALRLMPPPHRDRPMRPGSMVLAHLVFGSVLGAFVDRTAKRAANPT